MKKTLSFVLDLNGKIVVANDSVINTLNYSNDELRSMFIKDLLSGKDFKKLYKVTKNSFEKNERAKVSLTLNSKNQKAIKVKGMVEEYFGFYHLHLELAVKEQKKEVSQNQEELKPVYKTVDYLSSNGLSFY